jgi:hypothetical protein
MNLIHGTSWTLSIFAVFLDFDWCPVQFSPKHLCIRLGTEVCLERMIGQEVKSHDTQRLVVPLLS